MSEVEELREALRSNNLAAAEALLHRVRAELGARMYVELLELIQQQKAETWGLVQYDPATAAKLRQILNNI